MHPLGRWGEDSAADYLRANGFRILARNWRSGRLEIDLVAERGPIVAFVEVKARRRGPQSPLEALDRAKRRRLRRAAEAWIAAHGRRESEYRFDVIGVRRSPSGAPWIVHVKGAFTGEDS